MSSEKNPNRVAGGLKATINNPNISEDTKQDAQARLENFDSGEVGSAPRTTRGVVDDVDPSYDAAEYDDDGGPAPSGGVGDNDVPGYSQRQLGGFKATLHRDGTSEEAKEKARSALEAAGQSEEPL